MFFLISATTVTPPATTASPGRPASAATRQVRALLHETVLSEGYHAFELRASGLASGVYVVSARTDAGATAALKLVVIR